MYRSGRRQRNRVKYIGGSRRSATAPPPPELGQRGLAVQVHTVVTSCPARRPRACGPRPLPIAPPRDHVLDSLVACLPDFGIAQNVTAQSLPRSSGRRNAGRDPQGGRCRQGRSAAERRPAARPVSDQTIARVDFNHGKHAQQRVDAGASVSSCSFSFRQTAETITPRIRPCASVSGISVHRRERFLPSLGSMNPQVLTTTKSAPSGSVTQPIFDLHSPSIRRCRRDSWDSRG